jgi:hypothetical protein
VTVAQGEVVVAALLTEAESLKGQADAARSEAEEHRSRMFQAVECHFQNEWDSTVARLAEAGARLCAAFTRTGTPSPFR